MAPDATAHDPPLPCALGLAPVYCDVIQALLQADLGATTSYQIIEDLRQTAKAEDRRLEPDDIKAVLRATLIQVCVR